jgi:hypothetical protein
MWSVKDTSPDRGSMDGVNFLGHPNNASMVITHFDTKEKILNAKIRSIDHGLGEQHEHPIAMEGQAGFVPDDKLMGFDAHTEMKIAPYCPEEIFHLLHRDTTFARLAHSDWGGEKRYLIAALGLLNARNVAEVEHVDKTKQNRKRRNRGQHELCSHTMLKIRAIHKRSFLGKKGSGSGEDVRKHFVSGHWKTRRTGLFWWNPHWRGHGDGTVTHDYELRT